MPSVSIEQAIQIAAQHFASGRAADAEQIYSQILAADPQNPAALIAAAELAQRQGRTDASRDLLDRAVAAHPQLGIAHCRRGFILLEFQRSDEAEAEFRRAISLDPNDAEAHYGLSWVLLACGDFEQGWREHEWRLRSRPGPNVQVFGRWPRWDGTKLNGRRLFIYQEQGLGDMIQFARFFPQVAERAGASFNLGAAADLGQLFRRIPGVAEIALHPPEVRPFDLQLPSHSLPFVMQTTLDTIPNNVPYLSPEPGLVERWREKLDCTDGARRHIGLCWAGNPAHQNDRQRSIPLNALLPPLSRIPGLRLYSLQKQQPNTASDRMEIDSLIDWSGDLRDFSDTAAAIANLDLVISVDTATAHLAGAMGRPVWTLLPFFADYRWMLDREDSPWYPTMRLFRQKSRGDWDAVIKGVVDELASREA